MYASRQLHFNLKIFQTTRYRITKYRKLMPEAMMI
jgi:hypothetical protein